MHVMNQNTWRKLCSCWEMAKSTSLILSHLMRNAKVPPLPLHAIKGTSPCKALLYLLLEHSDKINLNNEDRQGQSGFVSACRKGHKEIVQRIIEVSDEKAIDLNLRDVELFTGLSVARRGRRFAIIELLEEASKAKKIDLGAKPQTIALNNWQCPKNGCKRKGMNLKSTGNLGIM